MNQVRFDWKTPVESIKMLWGLWNLSMVKHAMLCQETLLKAKVVGVRLVAVKLKLRRIAMCQWNIAYITTVLCAETAQRGMEWSAITAQGVLGKTQEAKGLSASLILTHKSSPLVVFLSGGWRAARSMLGSATYPYCPSSSGSNSIRR